MNKLGEERILSFWWIFVSLIISLFIIVGTITYYSETIDSRAIEADILTNKIIACVSNNFGEVFKVGFDIYAYCKLNDLGDKGNKEYYMGFALYSVGSCEFAGDVISCEKAEKTRFFGNDWQEYCDLQKEKGMQRKLPQCSEKYVYIVEDGEEKIMKVIGASNQKSGEIWKS